MGIDKANVRFVIHHSLPKSMDGLVINNLSRLSTKLTLISGIIKRLVAQAETGNLLIAYYVRLIFSLLRAFLLNLLIFQVYSYADAKTLMDLQIKEKEDSRIIASEEDKTRITEETRRVMDFCTNVSRCRRVQVLQYFGESFDPATCHNGCDVCCSTSKVTTRNVTTHAIQIVQLVQSMVGTNNTMNHCKSVFMGSRKKDVISRNHDQLPGHGLGATLGQRMVDLLFCELVTIGALQESPVSNNSGWSNNYLQVSPLSFVQIPIYVCSTFSWVTNRKTFWPGSNWCIFTLRRRLPLLARRRRAQKGLPPRPLGAVQPQGETERHKFRRQPGLSMMLATIWDRSLTTSRIHSFALLVKGMI